MNKKYLIIVIIGLSLLLACCSNPRNLTASKELYNGSITIPVNYIPTNLDPFSSQSNYLSQMIMDQFLPQSFYVNQFDEYQLNANLLVQAEIVSISPQTVLYQIQPNASWSDGIPITGQDFVSQWQECLKYFKYVNIGLICPPGYTDVKNIVVSNNGKTVKVQFINPISDWESLFNDILPAHIIQKYGVDQSYQSGGKALSISGGPFKITKYNTDEIVLTRNTKFFSQNPGINTIIFKRSRISFGQELTKIATGDHDLIISEPTSQEFANLVELGNKIAYQTAASNYILELVMNPTSQYLSNKVLRQAIAHYLNRQEITADTVGLLQSLETEENNHLVMTFQKLYTDNAGSYYSYNPAEADNLMIQAGYHQLPTGQWADANNGLINISLTFLTTNYYSKRAALLIQAVLRDFGFNIILTPVTTSQQLAAQLYSNFQMALVPVQTSSFVSNEPELVGLNQGFFLTQVNNSQNSASSTTTTAVNSNVGSPVISPFHLVVSYPSVPSGFGSPFDDGFSFDLSAGELPELASLYVDSVTSLYPPESQNYLAQADKLLWHQMVTLPLFYEPVLIVYPVNLANVTPDCYESGPFWNASSWSFLPLKQALSTQS